jgi:hypothetical protein
MADMRQTLTPRRARLLDIQGFDTVDMQDLAPVAPWLRLAFALRALLGGLGTVLASPTILLALALIAALAAASPVHPFDLIYNYGIRHVTGTGPLPRRGVPTRLGCAMGVRPCGSDPVAQPRDSPFQPDLPGDIPATAFFVQRGSHAEAAGSCRDPHARTTRAHGSTS